MYSCTIGLFIDFVECSFASAHGYVVNDVNITALVLPQETNCFKLIHSHSQRNWKDERYNTTERFKRLLTRNA